MLGGMWVECGVRCFQLHHIYNHLTYSNIHNGWNSNYSKIMLVRRKVHEEHTPNNMQRASTAGRGPCGRPQAKNIQINKHKDISHRVAHHRC